MKKPTTLLTNPRMRLTRQMSGARAIIAYKGHGSNGEEEGEEIVWSDDEKLGEVEEVRARKWMARVWVKDLGTHVVMMD